MFEKYFQKNRPLLNVIFQPPLSLLDIDYLLDWRDNFGSVTNIFSNVISNKELFEKECDILVPAAISNQITSKNAHHINASIVVEAANGPTMLDATKILDERDVLVVPDIIASAGGVTVSYFEWVQNLVNHKEHHMHRKYKSPIINIDALRYQKIFFY